jgi:hypothetical protein
MLGRKWRVRDDLLEASEAHSMLWMSEDGRECCVLWCFLGLGASAIPKIKQ